MERSWKHCRLATRSPDLMPLDYFFCVTMKQKVYCHVSVTWKELVKRIHTAANGIRAVTDIVHR
ncbi:unnamed protein product [Acanthoscelides obtectus]|uniref:Uncharacterized protein n=1 Tax=Acanthoscelides obtectus TaxID=200917 RepID=A0A9P0KNB3_ACAOB|nr:unnamed protein product [Acanthoscelides obtectus]CAK1631420.1 hypothetical protein AOBTE_LOCUS6941 [Acanthoscelides obtectus]